jgi:hypothetical protein
MRCEPVAAVVMQPPDFSDAFWMRSVLLAPV